MICGTSYGNLDGEEGLHEAESGSKIELTRCPKDLLHVLKRIAWKAKDKSSLIMTAKESLMTKDAYLRSPHQTFLPRRNRKMDSSPWKPSEGHETPLIVAIWRSILYHFRLTGMERSGTSGKEFLKDPDFRSSEDNKLSQWLKFQESV